LRLPMQPISSPPENRFGPRAAGGRWKLLGNRRFRRFPDRNAEVFSRSARHPRRTGPRKADSTARLNRGGIRTRFKYPKSSPTSVMSVDGISVKAVDALHHREFGAAFGRSRRIKRAA
jgi:hypothetical protein